YALVAEQPPRACQTLGSTSGTTINCPRRRACLRRPSMSHGRALARPRQGACLRLLCLVSLLFDPLCQPLVSRRDFLHCLLGLRVAHRIGLGKDLSGPCSPATDEQYKLIIRRNLAIVAFGQSHSNLPRVERMREAVTGSAKSWSRARRRPHPTAQICNSTSSPF